MTKSYKFDKLLTICNEVSFYLQKSTPSFCINTESSGYCSENDSITLCALDFEHYDEVEIFLQEYYAKKGADVHPILSTILHELGHRAFYFSKHPLREHIRKKGIKEGQVLGELYSQGLIDDGIEINTMYKKITNEKIADRYIFRAYKKHSEFLNYIDNEINQLFPF